MTRQITEADAALRMARQDRDSVVGLTRELVRIPSRAGIDPYRPVLGCMSSWLAGHGMLPRRLPGPGGETVALVCEITGDRPGPRYVLWRISGWLALDGAGGDGADELGMV